ncbi:MAG: hypothetical protein P8Y44_07855, partial [Acidobacteriota bacterium]
MNRLWIPLVLVAVVATAAWVAVDSSTEATDPTIAEAPLALPQSLLDRPSRAITAPKAIVDSHRRAEKERADTRALAPAQSKVQSAPPARAAEPTSRYFADGPSQIQLSEVPANTGVLGADEVRGGSRIESKMS